ncbi:sensor histidine kinase [Aquabacterium sp.]|uniref:sensor histidine kinase n=1 Tax=Aquabacterium sp. TaxID=1872578 RepID=UPI002C6B069A|nr:ATP-binding protein [Aquabacterium sp.]HSW03708.1 ATP-binding protein [Aquabacterium sp.]
MKSLYLRIWLTVVAALALFALISGWLWQRHLEQERARFEAVASERVSAWADLLERSLPAADAPPREQADALREWSVRLRMPMALDDAKGRRIGASESFLRREADSGAPAMSVRLDDGRTLWIARRLFRRQLTPGEPAPPDGPPGTEGPRGGPLGPDGPRGDMPRTDLPRGDGSAPGLRPPLPGGLQVPPSLRVSMLPAMGLGLPSALGPALLLGLLLLAVAAGAYPVVRRLTRRLESLKQGVEAFGAGQLGQRVDEAGSDEVAAVATTFNRAAERIETLVRSHQSLLANASHELRSPLARLKMAVALYADAGDTSRPALRKEIDANVAELDALVEEVLLASRLDASQALDREDQIDLLGVAAEEAARVGAQAGGEAVLLHGSERLLRRALRNLLENARRYGGDEVTVDVVRAGAGIEVRVCDRGPGVPEPFRERIFEAFFRLPGHAEREGGVGLGLSLVRQIAERHGGSVRCEPRQAGGSRFVLSLPAS